MTTQTSQRLDRARQLIEEELPHLISIRHDLHAHPELQYQETRTSGVVQRELESAGVEFVPGLAGGTGVLGHIPGETGSAMGLRADMDALPILEETGLGYASSIDGRMHACGHDGHTTILIGAARVLSRLSAESPLPQPVTMVFQPAEEGGAGGKRMCEEGALDGSRIGPAVGSMFGLHGHTESTVGSVGSRVGPLLAAADEVIIDIRGVGGHAAMPHSCTDPVPCAASIIQALQGIVSRNTNPLDSSVISITQLTAGDAFNVIPDTVRISGTVRSLQESTREMLERRIGEVATGIASAHGCTAVVDFIRGYPVTRNEAGAVATFERAAGEVLGDDWVRPIEHPVMGGEDFSFYGERVPACFFFLGLLPPGEQAMPSVHNARFDFNDEAIKTGVEVFCSLALGLGTSE
ncbi:MAG: amidohydrolase [Phycisphaerales bacterium]|nr:amidohydrolase [Phycisphaerales bacterium]